MSIPLDAGTRVAVVIAGHGSREAKAGAEFTALVAAYQQARPDLHVLYGYVELATPLLTEALHQAAQTSRQVVVIPLSLFSAAHVKNEIPLLVTAVAQTYPDVAFRVAPALGVQPKMVELVLSLLSSTAKDTAAGDDTALVVVGRGSSDPDANGDLYKTARLIGEGLGCKWVLPCFIGVTGPSLAQTLELAARARPKRLVVVPYFLFTGVLLQRLHAQLDDFAVQYPWIDLTRSAHLTTDPAFHAVLDERVSGALHGAPPLACMSCQYRVPLGKVAGQVGGLQALLFSLRHSFTHQQASTHKHAHKPIKKHVLVCTNGDCADRGSLRLLQKLRRLVKDAGQSRAIKVTKTSCMGRCGEGPTLVVYPDGIWYREVGEDDLPDLVQEHLMNDRLVERRVDHIM